MVHNQGISLCWDKEWFRPGFLLYRKFLRISYIRTIRCVPVQEGFVTKATARGTAKCASLFPQDGGKGDAGWKGIKRIIP